MPPTSELGVVFVYRIRKGCQSGFSRSEKFARRSSAWGGNTVGATREASNPLDAAGQGTCHYPGVVCRGSAPVKDSGVGSSNFSARRFWYVTHTGSRSVRTTQRANLARQPPARVD